MKHLLWLLVFAACTSPAEPTCVVKTDRVLDVTTGDTVAITYTICLTPRKT